MPRVPPGCNHKLDNQETRPLRAETTATVGVIDFCFAALGVRLVMPLFMVSRRFVARTVNLFLICIDINISAIAKSWRYPSGFSLNPG